MSINLENWCQFLGNVAPVDSLTSHDWICEVKRQDGVPKIEVLSKDQFDHFFENHPSRNCSRRKLSLNEIVSFSQNLLSDAAQTVDIGSPFFKDELRGKIKLKIYNLVSLINIFNTDTEEKISTELNQIATFSNMLQAIPTALEKMSQRAFDKKSIEKTISIWGRIKWMIWSWFFDKRSEITKIIKTVPNMNEDCKESTKAIQERILLNIEAFEEAIDIPYYERNSSSKPESMEKFSTPAKVKKLWLIKYAEDKYHGDVPPCAVEYRNRIISMLKIWNSLNKFDSGQNISEATPTDPSILLLEDN
jgi:hypothetical protein